MTSMPLHDGGHVRGVSLGNGRNGRRTEIPVDQLRAGSPSRGQFFKKRLVLRNRQNGTLSVLTVFSMLVESR